jgi:hypothetical protein
MQTQQSAFTCPAYFIQSKSAVVSAPPFWAAASQAGTAKFILKDTCSYIVNTINLFIFSASLSIGRDEDKSEKCKEYEFHVMSI